MSVGTIGFEVVTGAVGFTPVDLSRLLTLPSPGYGVVSLVSSAVAENSYIL